MDILVNNVKLYYEVYGEGQPIILLHGNQETHEIFDKLINKLKDNYKVYAIDSRCHGKSENPIDITYNLMCDDIIEFIKKLKIDKPILYGFSDGGIVGLLVAIKEPTLLSKLIVSGANITPDVLTPFFALITKIMYFFTRSKYIKMMLNEPNIQLNELNRIKIPVVVLAGEKDIIKYKHSKLIADNIPNSILEIVNKENHGSYIIHSDKIYEIIKNIYKRKYVNANFKIVDVISENDKNYIILLQVNKDDKLMINELKTNVEDNLIEFTKNTINEKTEIIPELTDEWYNRLFFPIGIDPDNNINLV